MLDETFSPADADRARRLLRLKGWSDVPASGFAALRWDEGCCIPFFWHDGTWHQLAEVNGVGADRLVSRAAELAGRDWQRLMLADMARLLAPDAAADTTAQGSWTVRSTSGNSLQAPVTAENLASSVWYFLWHGETAGPDTAPDPAAARAGLSQAAASHEALSSAQVECDLLLLIPVFMGTTFIVFFLAWGMPGDPLAGKCGDAECSDAFIAQATEQYRLNDPLLVRYVHYMTDVLQGDFGKSFTGRDVSEQLAGVFPTTMRLALMAVIFEALIGISLGMISARRPGGLFDGGNLLVGLVILAFPSFVIANLAQLFLGVRLGWFPVTVNDPSSVYQMLMPALVLAISHMVALTRLTRTTVIDSLHSDYVRTARTKGLSEARIMLVHVLRNSLIPVVTYIGKDIGGLLAGAVVVEGVFNIQGVGGLIVRSIRLHDGITIVGAVTVIVLIYLFVNLLVDLTYALLDPRIRYD